jgi:hypothetical protein
MNRFLIKKLEYPEDCIRIAKVALDYGYYITPTEAEILWNEHSNSMAAGWLYLPKKDSDIWYDIRGYFE